MERLTHKIVYDNEHCQYMFDYNQDSEVGTKLGELEDVLEEFELTSAEDLRNYLNFKTNMAIWEGELNYKNKISDLEQQLKSQPAEIVKKINGEIYTRMIVEGKETKYTDINLILDTILKEYQK